MGSGGVGDDFKKGKRKRPGGEAANGKDEPKRTRVHAQRKFAQGAGGASPHVSPLKEIRNKSVRNDYASSSSSSSTTGPVQDVKGERPKTEDFLTFLCLRGTDLLPPELDHFNTASSLHADTSEGDPGSSDQDDKDPEVDKNGAARKSSRRLSAVNSNLKTRKESSPLANKKKVVQDLGRKTRSQSQDSSHSSPERKPEMRQTRSQVLLHEGSRVARKNAVQSLESSDESVDDNDDLEADEEASSRESSRRPMTRHALESKMKAGQGGVIAKIKQREGRSTSRDSSQSKESVKILPITKSKPSEDATKEKIDENEDSKSPKDKSRDKKDKKKKDKSKTSLKDLQNILLEEAKRKIAADVPGEGEDVQDVSKNASPADSDTPDSEERITISQKTGYINVRPRNSLDQDQSSPSKVVAPVAGTKRLSTANERVPTPPRKILPKNDTPTTTTTSSSSSSVDETPSRTNHLPVGVIGAVGLSSRPMTSKQSSVSSLCQPLMLQTSSSSQSQPPAAPAIIVPAAPSAVQVRAQHYPTAVQGIPIMTPAGVQFGIPVGGAAGQNNSLQIRQSPVVTVPSFIRYTGFNQQQPPAQPIMASIASASGQSSSLPPLSQTITMPSGTTIQYNVPSSTIKSPLTSPGPPTLSPQIPSKGSTTVTKTPALVSGPPSLTPPVRPDHPGARREILGTPLQSPDIAPLTPQVMYHSPVAAPTAQYPSTIYSPNHPQHSPAGSYHSPQPAHLLSPGHHQLSSPTHHPLSPHHHFSPPPPTVQYNYQTSQQQQQPVFQQQQQQPQLMISPQGDLSPKPPSLHSPLTHSSAPKQKQESVSDNRSESSESSSTSSSQRKQKSETKMLKSKFGAGRKTKTFDVEDNSSPYAFDNDVGDSPNLPFRKSSSPLKPPAMIKKSLLASAKSKKSSEQAHADLRPTGSKMKKQESEAASNDNKGETVEDTSSSDNETTYFIPLKNSTGQSFGVALKLGTDGPCGPNQKVIMTAKLVTDPATKPTKAKILGAKTTETSSLASSDDLDAPIHVQSSSTPVKENMTPRKMMNANSSPVTTDSKSHVRRVLSPDINNQQSSSKTSVKDSMVTGGKRRPMCLIGQVNTGKKFPRLGQHAQMMEAPTFRPTEAEFKDPLKYIEKIRGYAEQFGMCKIIPPKSFKPECNVDDDMRFTAYNQYINRMMNRTGPNSKETAAIKKYLETQNCDTRNHPLVGGLEVDLPALYHAVQSFGGLSEVIQKKMWPKIADYMRVVRGANINAAANKLDDIYVKWLLPYDTLSNVEREELIRLVEEEWTEKAEKSRVKEETGSENDDDTEDEDEEDEDQEAVVKGKSTSLTQFYRTAKNLMSSIFRSEDPPHHIVEDEYWKIVSDRDVHLQVSQGSIDTGSEGYGFPIRNSPFASHPWNLKQLTNNPRSVLRAMGKVMGVTAPTLHVGMLFTTGCWYRDPHGLPWVEFLHTGAPKIWYGIPDDHSLAFYTAMKQLVPGFCKNRKIWLPSDTTMVSPQYLVKHGVSVCRAVQSPGQFVVVFPRSYTSSISSGYNVSESVYYAPKQWLSDVDNMFQDIRDSQEPMMFPIEKILFALATDNKATKYVLEKIKPKVRMKIFC